MGARAPARRRRACARARLDRRRPRAARARARRGAGGRAARRGAVRARRGRAPRRRCERGRATSRAPSRSPRTRRCGSARRELARYLRIAQGGYPAAQGLLDRGARELPAGDAEGRLELEADRFALLAVLSATRRARAPRVRAAARVLAPATAPAERRMLADARVPPHDAAAPTTGAEVGRLAERALGGGRLRRRTSAPATRPCSPRCPRSSWSSATTRSPERRRRAGVGTSARPPAGRGRVHAGRCARGSRSSAATCARPRPPRATRCVSPSRRRSSTSGASRCRRSCRSWSSAASSRRPTRGSTEPSEQTLLGPGATRWQILQARAPSAARRAASPTPPTTPRRAPIERGGASAARRAMRALALHGLGDSGGAPAGRAGDSSTPTLGRAEHARDGAARARASIAGDLALLRRAVEALAPTPRRLEHARALVDLGAALRRANRARGGARAARAPGMELAHRVRRRGARGAGARRAAWRAGRGRGALMRSGVDALTPSELRVAQLAAARPHATARSRRRCSSRARRSRRTSAASIASSASTRASGSRRNSRTPHPMRARRRRGRLSPHELPRQASVDVGRALKASRVLAAARALAARAPRRLPARAPRRARPARRGARALLPRAPAGRARLELGELPTLDKATLMERFDDIVCDPPPAPRRAARAPRRARPRRALPRRATGR